MAWSLKAALLLGAWGLVLDDATATQSLESLEDLRETPPIALAGAEFVFDTDAREHDSMIGTPEGSRGSHEAAHDTACSSTSSEALEAMRQAAVDDYLQISAGYAKRGAAEAQAKKAVWTWRQSIEEENRSFDIAQVEKLLIRLQVYLNSAEERERKEQIARSRGEGGRPNAHHRALVAAAVKVERERKGKNSAARDGEGTGLVRRIMDLRYTAEGSSIALRDYVQARMQHLPQADSQRQSELWESTLLASTVMDDDGLTGLAALLLRLIGLAGSPLRAAWELTRKLQSFQEDGLGAISIHLDHRRYMVVRGINRRLEPLWWAWEMAWDAPVALYQHFFPPRDRDFELPEAAVLRQAIGMANEAIDLAHRGGGQASSASKAAQRMLELDTGPGRRFAGLAQQCFTLSTDGFEYEVCPFKVAKLAVIGDDKHGSKGTAVIGRRGRLTGDYTIMLMEGGDRCGEHQSLAEVRLVCGEGQGLRRAQEVESCRHVIQLETPAACTEELLRQAEQRLEEHGVDREAVGWLAD